jgi:hypothetical protein
MDAATLIERLGGTSAVARLLDEPVSTVQSWKKKNRIPRWRLPRVQALLPAPESASQAA